MLNCLLAQSCRDPNSVKPFLICKKIKAECPDLTILWGGYFPSNHSEVVVRSGFVDYAIQGQGEAPFRQFVDTLHKGGSLDDIPSLVI